MNRYMLLFAGICLGAFAAAGAGNEFVKQRISDSAVKPVIDGVIDDAEWADAAVLPGFILIDDRCIPADEALSLRMKYDADNLYIALRSRMDFDPNIERVADDDANMRGVDSLQITLVGPVEHYWYSFMIERAGGKSEWRYHLWDNRPRDEWNPEWQYRARIIPDRFFEGSVWEAEMAIPWTALDMTAPKEKVELPAQMVRFHGNSRTTSVGTRMSSWAGVTHEWHLPDPNTFGTLEFMPGKPVFRCDGAIDNYERGQGAFTGEYTGKGFDFSARVWDRGDYSSTFVDETVKVPGDRLDWHKKLEVKGAHPAMWSYTVTDADGVVARIQACAELRQPFFADVQPVYSREELVWLGEITLDKLPEKASIQFELLDADGVVIERKSIPVTEAWFEERLPLQHLVPGATGKGIARLLDAQGSELYRIETPVTQLETPGWMTAHYGEVTAPFGPWRPMRAVADNGCVEVEVFKHKLTFEDNPLPESVAMFGEDFSAGAWRFVIETADGMQELQPLEALKITGRDERGVTMRWRGASDEVELAAEIRIEFDALAWYEITLSPLKPGVELRRLAVACPLAAEKLRYMRATGSVRAGGSGSVHALIAGARTDRPIPEPSLPFIMDISGKGWIFGNRWNSLYWIGGEDRGLEFVLPSMRNMKIRDAYSKAEENGDIFELTFNLVDTPVALDKALDYQFGFVFTPAREIGDRARLRKVGQFYTGENNWLEDYTIPNRVHSSHLNQYPGRFLRPEKTPEIPRGYFTSMQLPCWIIPDCQSGNPRPRQSNVNAIRNHVRGIEASIGGMPCLWYDSLITTLTPNPPNDFLADFRRYPIVNHPIETPATTVCSNGSWPDYYLSGVVERLGEGVECFYMDMSTTGPCSNRFHGCGWRDDNGEVHGEIPFLAIREQFLRMQKLVKDNNPDGLLLEHGSPLEWAMNWIDVNVFGEEWTTARDYSTLSPELFQAGYACTRQIGAAHSHFAGLIYLQYPGMRDGNVTQADILGLTLLHGDSVYTVNGCEIAGNMMVWDALDAFGVDRPDAEWIPYWRNPLSRYPEGAAVSSWKRGNAELIVVYNVAATPVAVELPADLALVNALDGKPAANRFELPGRDFRLLKTK